MLVFNHSSAQDVQVQDVALSLEEVAEQAKVPVVVDDRTKFVDRLSFFTPAFTKHLSGDDFEYNEINVGGLLGVNLNKNSNSKITTTAYGGVFKNSYGDISPIINFAFETRKGLDVLGYKDVLAAGVGLMAAHYPSQKEFITGGPVPYAAVRLGHGVAAQVGYIALSEGKPSLTGGTLVLSFSAHLSSVFDWAKKTTQKMNANKGSKTPAQSFQPSFH